MFQSPKFYSLSLFLSSVWLTLMAQQNLWKPVADEVFLQEKSEIMATDSPVTQVAFLSGRFHAVMDGKLHELKNGGLQPLANSPEGIGKMKVYGQAAWVMTSSGLFRFEENNWEKLSEARFVDMCMHLGKIHAATKEAIFVYMEGKLSNIEPEGGYLSNDITMLMEDGTQLLADPVKLGAYYGNSKLQRNTTYSQARAAGIAFRQGGQ